MQVWDDNHEEFLRSTLVTMATESKTYLCGKKQNEVVQHAFFVDEFSLGFT